MRTLSKLLAGLVASLIPDIAFAQAPKSGGTLTYAVTAEAPSTDCHAITTYAAVHVLAPHYSLLLKVDPDNYPKLKPDVAESWTVSPDGLTFTFGGVKIDTSARVIDTDGAPIPGLYAAGEMVGGIFYFNYPGGTGLTNGSVFGRIAGTTAGARARGRNA